MGKPVETAAAAYVNRHTESSIRKIEERAFLAGADWQRAQDIEIAFGVCDNDTGHEVADEIRKTAFDEAQKHD